MKRLFLVVMMALGLAGAAQASLVELSYQARVTGGSNLAATGLAVGVYFTGAVAYDTTTPVESSQGFWGTTYGVGGTGNMVSAFFPNRTFAAENPSITVSDGPVFGKVQNDSVTISGTPSATANFYQSIYLSFGTLGLNQVINSTALPTDSQMKNFEYSGGSISLIYGTPLDSENFYVKQYSYFGDYYSIYSVGNGCNGCGIPSDPGNTDFQRYLQWVDAGNTPLETASVDFAITNVQPLSAVPLPATAWLFLTGGIGLFGAAAKRRKAH